jgi:cell wall-associated NlpC family hydrolase
VGLVRDVPVFCLLLPLGYASRTMRIAQALALVGVLVTAGCERPRPSSWAELPRARGHHAASIAMSFHGRPYCWGGTGPDCFDCSGLTFAAWSAAGRAIPRTSAAQHQKLASVPMHALEPGDILWRPGHVGLYVGEGWAIHAPGRGKPVQYQPAAKYRAAHRPSW